MAVYRMAMNTKEFYPTEFEDYEVQLADAPSDFGRGCESISVTRYNFRLRLLKEEWQIARGEL